jgi:hypothetical protein
MREIASVRHALAFLEQKTTTIGSASGRARSPFVALIRGDVRQQTFPPLREELPSELTLARSDNGCGWGPGLNPLRGAPARERSNR